MFGTKLKDLRKKYNFTQKDLAEKLGLTPAAIGLYEQGRRTPDVELIVKIAKIFDISTDYLLIDSDTKPAIIPDELKELGVQYIALAKSFKDNEIPPEDVEKLLKVIKGLKK
ncbi:helix-turn-helix domain-containing protein [Abyssisolibacter fermentans]|uniref:helix-turn-helix domain-containing protein n=1 Tax=Abyssisolibacter fermentans TaxID=1766203 RepID=UPI0009E76E38|nr:helix-turn-helix transcriptional regulator [Abyssisolibacter fermentans]